MDNLEQVLEQAPRNGSRALPQIRAAIDQVIEDSALRGIMRDEATT